ncbi:hypothetical protein CPB84DRAFT_1850777 [Gymnopilus junonius]|uniref:Uncharacterized protein n=1 Tax=Gymnopilus junonius TaxID=109634 RepID=A0A9P5NDL5_GYMJU|nr:hypothetical protein CPB84DRAFT_1850777 [Gymnopilus junonius]
MFDLIPSHQQTLSSNIFLNHEQDKIDSGNLYYCQPHTVIQLVEVAPPPPRNLSSVINSSSAESSSYASTSSSSYAEDDEDEEMDEDEEEEESVCSSYCSSDFAPEDQEEPSSSKPAVSYWPQSDSLAGLKKRILLWREHFEAPLLDSDPSSLKRKLEKMDELEVDDSDNVSHTSKRSRSHGSSVSSRSISSEELNMHPCPACDAFFPSLQSLRQHGSRDAPESNEACCVAVEYAFEQ